MYSLAFDQSYMISPSTVESDMPEDRRSHSHNRRYGDFGENTRGRSTGSGTVSVAACKRPLRL
jgi:hypothetical protein